MATYTIRKATLDDCDSVVGLIKELAEYEEMPDQVDMTAEKLREDAFCSEPFVNILVAVCSLTGQTVAYSTFSYMYSTWKGRTMYMDDVYVTPAHRGAGLGTSLMQAVAQCALHQGCNRMNWIVLRRNVRPKALYARLGAEDLTEREGWNNMTLFRGQLKAFAKDYKVNVKEDTTINVSL